jgi:hypothetical protein
MELSINWENPETAIRMLTGTELVPFPKSFCESKRSKTLFKWERIGFTSNHDYPDENVLSMERSLVAIKLKRIQKICVNTRFFYLLERTITSG